LRTPHLFFISLLLLPVFFSGGCRKEKTDEGKIPNVYVNFVLYPNSFDFIAVSGYKYINNQGYRGIIVYRPDIYTFLAYERTCPFDPEKECAIVEVEDSGITAVDSCCMTRYLLMDGSPFEGPGSLPLKQYRTNFDGDVLLVYN